MAIPLLRKGSSGPSVQRLKQWLNRALGPTVELGNSPIFDAQTEQAVLQLQRQANLSKPDGVVGPKTWAAIGTILGQRSDVAAPADRMIVGPLNINQGIFFSNYFQEFEPPSQSQYDGLSRLLTFIDLDPDVADLRWAAYMLATTYHETAHTWQPIAEYGKGAGHTYGEPVKVKGSDGKTYENTYYGRGYVQLTWKNNYQTMSTALGMGDELLVRPDRVMEPDIAYRIMSYGMRHGSFTGKKLQDHIGEGRCDYYNARTIINGHDCAGLIKGYALKLETILRASLIVSVSGAGATH